MPFLRLTVLGAPGSGKTSLINSWVNNFCPTVHSPTEKPELYYRTVRLHCSDKSVLSRIIGFEHKLDAPTEEDELITVLVEIEDTPPPRREQEKGGRPRWDLESIGLLMKTDRDRNRAPIPGVAPFAKLRAPGLYHISDYEEATDNAERPPEASQVRDRDDPLTWMRMCFVVVFDVSDPDSFLCAQQIYKKLGCSKSNCHQVWLVANKTDKDPLNPNRDEVFAAVKEYAKKRAENCSCPQRTHEGMMFMDGGVSALEFTRVRKLFRDVFEGMIVQKTDTEELLWVQDTSEGAEVRDETTNRGGGVIGSWFPALWGGT